MHTYYIKEIINSNDNKKMEQLREVVEKAITDLKYVDYAKYEDIECKLYEIIEGKKLNEEKAREWVARMEPMAMWSMEDIKQIKENQKVDIPLVDLYALMNMLHSDYENIIGTDTGKYVEFAKDWYNDIDSSKKGSEKLYCYWKHFGR